MTTEDALRGVSLDEIQPQPVAERRHRFIVAVDPTDESAVIILERGKGALYVADRQLRRGFSYNAGETENELRRWSE